MPLGRGRRRFGWKRSLAQRAPDHPAVTVHG
jgi:hypothetical protein